jgi:hypothetical protein
MPNTRRVLVARKKSPSSTGSPPGSLHPVVCHGLIVQIPHRMAVRSAADRYRAGGNTPATTVVR